ncbi:DMT family transporter [Hahella aquimaris]|uniref:DMT family transporter n=1 Tax=Hahella sp. HNIBRBA332 TaxID=3015983 RepID=UPI00273C514D|nr:DMT family transporter [Hahella sp. HNIBRBA332]WLQ15324.1 DMT family transporter [Hahella sp. HNIBRBA332]
MPQDRFLRGVAFIILGECFFVLTGMVVKHISLEAHVWQMVFFRNLFGLAFLTPLLLRSGRSAFKTQRLPLHFLRAALGVAAFSCLIYTFASIRLAEATMLKLMLPLFIPVIAWVWLRERPTPILAFSLGLGFLGVIIILQPDSLAAAGRLAILAGLCGSLFAAGAKVVIGRLGSTEPSVRIVFYFNLFSTLLSCIPMLWYWQALEPATLVWLFLFAILATVGQLSTTHAYTLASPGKIGLYSYASLPIAGLLGWLIWSEEIYLELWIGSGLIVLAGALTFFYSRPRKPVIATAKG